MTGRGTILSPVIRALICTAAVAGAVLVTSTAGAHSPTPWFGTYSVSVSGGSQDTSWTLNHTPTSRCDAPSNGQGSDDQDFLAGAAKTTEITGAGTVAFPTTIAGLELNYTESREGSITEGTPEAGPSECAGPSGEASKPPQPDCGTRSLTTLINVDPAPGSASIESGDVSAAGEPPYDDCPVFGNVVPAFASPVVATLPPLGPASDGGLASGHAKLTATEPITETDTSGQTTLNLELTFTRLAVFDALGMPADTTLTVGSNGDVNVPVTCPAGSACSGTVSLDLGAAASTSSRRVGFLAASSAPRYPAPLSGFAVALSSAKFHLRPHQRGVRLRIQGGRLFARSLAKSTLAVVISEGSGKKSARYVAGTAQLRP
jgi:hypothetical protein